MPVFKYRLTRFLMSNVLLISLAYIFNVFCIFFSGQIEIDRLIDIAPINSKESLSASVAK